ncbi:MAG: DsbA family protein [Candidatus Omnitrophica bacterium]|nr:DsbA family protein [Candidatus Omnitrophota bacterium]
MKIENDFFRGILTGVIIAMILIFAVQSWDFFRYSWFTKKIEVLMVRNAQLEAAQKGGPGRPGQNPPGQPPAPQAAVKFEDLKGKPSQGPENAPVTIVEFSDFYCPFCKRLTPTLEEAMKKYPGKLRRIWRHFPLPMHAGAQRTHEASACAGEQGKFWEYHDAIFSSDQPPQGDEALTALAQKFSLNQKKFEDCLKNGRGKAAVDSDIAAGNKIGVRGTPTLFINGKLSSGAQPIDALSRTIEAELSKKK